MVKVPAETVDSGDEEPLDRIETATALTHRGPRHQSPSHQHKRSNALVKGRSIWCGRCWVRTTVGDAGRFAVCHATPLWLGQTVPNEPPRDHIGPRRRPPPSLTDTRQPQRDGRDRVIGLAAYAGGVIRPDHTAPLLTILEFIISNTLSANLAPSGSTGLRTLGTRALGPVNHHVRSASGPRRTSCTIRAADASDDHCRGDKDRERGGERECPGGSLQRIPVIHPCVRSCFPIRSRTGRLGAAQCRFLRDRGRAHCATPEARCRAPRRGQRGVVPRLVARSHRVRR